MLQLDEQALAKLDALGLTALLRARPNADTAAEILGAVARLPKAEPALVEAFLDVLEAAGAEAVFEQAQTLPTDLLGLNGYWLLAQMAQSRGDMAAARVQWQHLIDRGGGGQMAEALLAQARIALRERAQGEALDLLRAALRVGGNSQNFLLRAERLYRSCVATQAAPGGQALRIALLGSSTTTFLGCALRMAAVRDGFVPEIYEGSYGAFRQEILNPQSDLYAFEPQFVIIATHWRDAHLPAIGATLVEDSDMTAQAALVAKEFRQLWELLLARLPCTVLQANFDLPWNDAAGHLGFAHSSGRPRQLLALNEALRKEAPRGVVIVEADMLSATVGKQYWASPRQWYMNKQHPAPECLPQLASAYMALIRAVLGKSKKVLVLDLDNTLWGGVIGEDGIAGLRLGAPSPDGEAYVAFQHYVSELKARGVLLAVCSKNNPADARLPFEQHEAMVLKLDDFVAFDASWQDKPQSLRQMANALKLGLDSFVFVDDNPAERTLMRRELPQVAVPEIDASDPAGYIDVLQREHYFEALTLSEEDVLRHTDYKANAERERLLGAVTDQDSFLRALDMTVTHGAFDERVVERVLQLLGKTNQFNLTTRRHNSEQIARLMANSTVWTQWFRLEDRFGDNGLIGLLIAVPVDDETWEIDSFLMSCRVIGREMELSMISILLAAARERGIRHVIGRYIPTAKNAMVRDLYLRLGFHNVTDPLPLLAQKSESGEELYVFDLADPLPVVPEFFKLCPR